MQIGMIGAGRMGGSMVRRLLRGGHACVVHSLSAQELEPLVAEGATAAASLAELVERLNPPRAVWLMVPAAAVDATLDALVPLLARGDTVIDGGNSHFADDLRRAEALGARGLHYLDVGTSGGVWGLERGYCLMIGGDADAARPVPLGAIDVVPVEGVAAVDHDVARVHPSGQGVGRRAGERRRDHDPDRPRDRETLQQVVERAGSLRALLGEEAHRGRVHVEGHDLVTVPQEAAREVRSHPAETHHADPHRQLLPLPRAAARGRSATLPRGRL